MSVKGLTVEKLVGSAGLSTECEADSGMEGDKKGKLVVILASNDATRAMLAFITAAVSAEMGNETYLIVTLNGIDAIVRGQASRLKAEKGFVGSVLKKRMPAVGLPDNIEDLYRIARKSGVKVYVDQMSLRISGLRREDLLDFDELVGPGTIADLAAHYNSILF